MGLNIEMIEEGGIPGISAQSRRRRRRCRQPPPPPAWSSDTSIVPKVVSLQSPTHGRLNMLPRYRAPSNRSRRAQPLPTVTTRIM
jgi:hypothetical protein